MFAARFRGVARTSVILCGLALASCEVRTEPLHLVVASATADTDLRTSKPIVTIRLTEDSGRRFAIFTTKKSGQVIDIRVSGKSVSKPIVREPIIGGSFQIDISDSKDAEMLAIGLSDQTAMLEVETIPK
jgi:hypothetical protein